jgi:hypothetical protein
MKPAWSNKDYDSIVLVRLLSQLETTSEILKILNEEDDRKIIDLLKSKYDKMYFDLHKFEHKNGQN